MLKKWLLASIASVLIFSIAAGCGEQKDNTDNKSGADIVQTPPANKEEMKQPVELAFYHPNFDWPEERFNRVIAEPLKKKFPHITATAIPYVKVAQIGERIAANEPIDVIFTSTGQVFDTVLAYDMQMDLTELMKKHNFDVNTIEPAAVNMIKSLSEKDEIYGLPAFVAPTPVYYNKEIFDKFGEDYPTDGMTWDDMYTLAKKLTRLEDNVQYRGFLMSVVHLARRNPLSLEVINPETMRAATNTSEWKGLLENVLRFYDMYNLEKSQLPIKNQRELFLIERSVGMWAPVATLHSREDLQDMNWDMTTFPTLKENPGTGLMPYPVAYFVTKSSKTPDDAFQAIAYLTSEEYQTEWVKQGEIISALKSDNLKKVFGQDTELFKGKNIKALLPEKYAEPFTLTRFNNIADGNLFNEFNLVVLGEKDLNTALRDAEQLTNKRIEEELAKMK